uniref:Uncharacterized protein n=1 Tax=Candidatus Kentrum sp. TC TaxID=2126339 RepID=A0A450Z5I5_9GAMM|nr:MAG: hypothetical protein BECKTC1821D_GA0114238_106611 [Candidatus Kentron sp. TC]VFK63535.1 MAG: hypothetical protein BECKTC1821F_GA0114240_10988 [Candidatus Kentron sp. TC]
MRIIQGIGKAKQGDPAFARNGNREWNRVEEGLLGEIRVNALYFPETTDMRSNAHERHYL